MTCEKQSIQTYPASDESRYPSVPFFSHTRLEESGFGNEPVAGQPMRYWR